MDILLNVQFIDKQRCTKLDMRKHYSEFYYLSSQLKAEVRKGYSQMLFLSGERMRERFDVLWPVGIYFWVERSCDFMNEESNLLY